MRVAITSGAGPSPLDPLDGQPLAIAVTFDHPASSYDTPAGCRETALDELQPPRVATGATAALVTTNVLDILPEWDVKLDLCEPSSGSTATLHSDNNMGLGLIFGCSGLPPSALASDSAGHPLFTSFTVTSCSATLYDQANGRLFGGQNMMMVYDAGS